MARSELLDTRLGVETPEGVVLELRPAGLTARFGAFSIDLAVRSTVVYFLFATVLGMPGSFGTGVSLVLVFLVEWFYPVFFEVWNRGATPGKRALNITVVEDNGLPVSFAASMIRNLLRFVDFLPLLYGAAVVSMVLTRDFKRLGDIAAGTRVVHADAPPTARALPSVVAEAPPQPVPFEVQQAVIALAERSSQLTPERIRELTRLADRVLSLPPDAAAEQRLWRFAAWFLGHREGGRPRRQGVTPVEFEARHGPCWERLTALLAAVSTGGTPSSTDIGSLPRLYRETCQHLALARDRGYPQHLVDRLNELARQGHEVLYRPRTRFLSQAWRFVAIDFPERVRAERGLMLLSAAALFLPLAALGLLLQHFPVLVHSTLEPGMLVDIERMYAPGGDSIGKLRSGDTDLMMFGHYINNNIGISFQVFATGIVPFLGPMFYLLLNGIIIGSVAGHLTHIGFGGTFWPFVSGHGSFELTAIVIAGGAGLMLSRALVAPGDLPRRTALMVAARGAVQIMYGVVLMLVIAAAIEAFWSSSRWTPAWVKYSAAAVLWAAVAYYFLFQGRARGAMLWTSKR